MQIKNLYKAQNRTLLMTEAKNAARNSNQVVTFNGEIIRCQRDWLFPTQLLEVI